MNAARRLERRWLGLPPARSRAVESSLWMTAPDGARLATRVLRPADAGRGRGGVLIRTEGPPERDPTEKLARWLAEDGRSVVIQTCRGRGGSEGDFRPFADEAADGGAALGWLEHELEISRGVVALGLGYSAFTAWAALAAEPARVAGLAAGFGARDPYAWLHAGGALQLEVALALAAQLDGRVGFAPEELDLARAGRHRPLGECDRVAVRELAAFRDWLAHPERDAWWAERTPALPAEPPPVLFALGSYDGSLAAAQSDYEQLVEGAAAAGRPLPSLLLGPWGAAPLPLRRRPRGARRGPELARAVLAFVARALGERAPRAAPARVFLGGAGWRETARWPPARGGTRTLYLRGGGRANSSAGDGRLATEPPGAEGPDQFTADPADPVPSLGGAALWRSAGPLDQRPVEERGDVLCFTGDPLPGPGLWMSRASVALHTDPAGGWASAKLVAVEADGTARWLGEGIGRADPGSDGMLEIRIGGAGARLAAGTRLRLEVSAPSTPRFARPDSAAVRVHRIHHDAQRASALHLETLD